MEKRLEQFLEELKAIRDKYGYEFYGCGCCDCIRDIETGESLVSKVWFDDEQNKYDYY